MKAAFLERYGIANIELRETEMPVPADNEALVRVRASSVNPADWYGVVGRPHIARLMRGMGLRKPRTTRFGTDFAGTVEAVGKDVTHVQPGDDVLEPIPVGRHQPCDDEALSRHPTREVDDGSRGQGRRLADSGRGVGADGAALAAAPCASARLPQPARPRPGRDERDPARAAHGDAVERAERDRDLLLELGAPPLPGVGAGGRVRGVLAARAVRLRRAAGDRVGVAVLRRAHGQGAPGWRGDRPQSHR